MVENYTFSTVEREGLEYWWSRIMHLEGGDQAANFIKSVKKIIYIEIYTLKRIRKIFLKKNYGDMPPSHPHVVPPQPQIGNCMLSYGELLGRTNFIGVQFVTFLCSNVHEYLHLNSLY